jgi:hypothetical protein
LLAASVGGTLRTMTESATRKPQFARRRVIAGAVLLVLVLAVARFVFGVFDPKPPVKLRFVRFEESSTYAGIIAVLVMTNCSAKTYSVQPANSYSGTVDAYFISQSSTGEVTWGEQGRNFGLYLRPHEEITRKTRLPEDGRVGRLSVGYIMVRTNSVAMARILPKRLCERLMPRFQYLRAFCDEEIQSPKRTPYGTVEPPRLVPKGERKTP